MIGRLCFVAAVLASAFKSKIRLEAENATLRHQLVVLRRKLKDRPMPWQTSVRPRKLVFSRKLRRERALIEQIFRVGQSKLQCRPIRIGYER
jgi:hypothetical protein